MIKLPLSIHLTVLECSFVFMALGPAVCSLTVHHITGELTHVLTAIGEDSHTLPMSLVSKPCSLVLCHNSIFVPLSRVKLQTVAMSHHLELLDALLLGEWLDFCFVNRRSGFNHLSI